jgi:glycosyltransferase involved in cell wall biosynthesis
MPSPAVAIITPYFNTGPIFGETIASLRAQSLQQWEWVVVDDGSDDPQALEVLAQLREHGDPRVRVIAQPNRGLPAARNAGVAASSAPLLFFLDSDDLLAPTALEQLAWLLHSDARPAFATAWQRIFGAESLEWQRGFESRDHFLFENMVAPTVMIRRAVFEAVGGFDESLTQGLEDYELWLRCASQGFWGRDIHAPLVEIRRKAAHEYPGYAWRARDDAQARAAFEAAMRRRYPRLYAEGLPRLAPADDAPFAPIPQALPFENRLRPAGAHRLLLLLADTDLGGVSRFALDMVASLAARGYAITICATLPGQQQRWRAEFERYAEVFVLEQFLQRRDYPRFLRYLIGSRAIDTLLISNSVLGYRLLPYLRAHCPGLAFVDYNHMRDADCANAGGPGFSAELHELLDMHLASSEDLRDWIVGQGAPIARAHVVYTAVDTQRWQPDPGARAAARARLGIGEQTPLLLYAARISAQKQPLVFARVIARLARQGLRFACVVAGDGPELPALRTFVRRQGLSARVHLLGAVDAERMRELMAAADILFLPSAYEGLALVLYEALASGTIPVTVDAGGQRELITPEVGVLVPPDARQEQRYAAALEWLILAARQREAMAKAGRRRVLEHFSGAQLGERLEGLLREARHLAAEQPRPSVSAGAGIAAAGLAVEELRLYQRNRSLRVAVRAWEWWKAYGRRYASRIQAARERGVLRSYPLRRGLRPFLRRGRRPTLYR